MARDRSSSTSSSSSSSDSSSTSSGSSCSSSRAGRRGGKMAGSNLSGMVGSGGVAGAGLVASSTSAGGAAGSSTTVVHPSHHAIVSAIPNSHTGGALMGHYQQAGTGTIGTIGTVGTSSYSIAGGQQQHITNTYQHQLPAYATSTTTYQQHTHELDGAAVAAGRSHNFSTDGGSFLHNQQSATGLGLGTTTGLAATTTTTTQQTRQYTGTTDFMTENTIVHDRGTRILRTEKLPERIIGEHRRQQGSGRRIVGTIVTEHEVRVPKKLVIEETFEKTIISPFKQVREEIVEETIKKQQIQEVVEPDPVVIERIIEEPVIVHVEKLVEVETVVRKEKPVYRKVTQYVDRPYEVKKIVPRTKMVEKVEHRYIDVPVEKIVEVPEKRVVVKKVPVPQPQIRERKEYKYVDVPKPYKVQRKVPVPIEAVSTYEIKVPKLRPKYGKVTYPVYLPRFIEVPVPREVLLKIGAQAEHYLAQVSSLTGTSASLCEIENLAAQILKHEYLKVAESVDMNSIAMESWNLHQQHVTAGNQGLFLGGGVGGGATTTTTHYGTSSGAGYQHFGPIQTHSTTTVVPTTTTTSYGGGYVTPLSPRNESQYITTVTHQPSLTHHQITQPGVVTVGGSRSVSRSSQKVVH